MLLLAVPEAVSSHTKVRSRSAVQSILCVAPRYPRGSLVPYKSEDNHFSGALLTEISVLAGWFDIAQLERGTNNTWVCLMGSAASLKTDMY